MAFTAKTIHAQRQIEYGNNNEHDTLALMISKTDKSVGQLTGNLDICNAVVFLQKKIVEEDSLDKTKLLKGNMEDYEECDIDKVGWKWQEWSQDGNRWIKWCVKYERKNLEMQP